MLSYIYTKNYKNLSFDKPLPLKALNIFIGANGSGKSNIIKYLKFLSEASKQEKENHVKIVLNRLNRPLNLQIAEPASFEFIYAFSDILQGDKNLVLDLSIHVDSQKEGKQFIESELVYQKTGNIDKTTEIHEDEIFHSRVYPDEKKGIFYSKDPTRPLFLGDFARAEREVSSPSMIVVDRESAPILYFLNDVCRWKFYNANDFDVSAIKTASNKVGDTPQYLSSGGENLITVINSLMYDLDFEEELNQALKSMFPKTRKIRAVIPGRTVEIQWYIEPLKDPLYLDEMSDGTIRMLCLAVILLSPKLPSMIVIDEPELGLHPAWLKILAQWIKRASEKTQVIISTHSPDLLDQFTDCIENVHCFYQQDNNYFGIKTLSQESLQPQLDEGWELGDLYRVGDPLVGGWPW
jgi:predicted ATPase